MAIAVGAQSAPATGGGAGTQAWTHPGGAAPRGVLVLVAQLMGTSSIIDTGGVTYGGVPLAPVRPPLLKSTGETMGVHAYFLGAGAPSGDQQVVVNVVGTNPVMCRCYTLAADADTEVIDFDVISGDAVADPFVVLSTGARPAFGAIVFISGHDSVAGVTPLAGWTADFEVDGGAICAGVYRLDAITAGDITAGWTQTAEDAVAIAVAIGEVESGTAITGIANTTAAPAVVATGRKSASTATEPIASSSAGRTATAVSKSALGPSAARAAGRTHAIGARAVPRTTSVSTVARTTAEGAKHTAGSASTIATGAATAIGQKRASAAAHVQAAGSTQTVGTTTIGVTGIASSSATPGIEATGRKHARAFSISSAPGASRTTGRKRTASSSSATAVARIESIATTQRASGDVRVTASGSITTIGGVGIFWTIPVGIDIDFIGPVAEIIASVGPVLDADVHLGPLVDLQITIHPAEASVSTHENVLYIGSASIIRLTARDLRIAKNLKRIDGASVTARLLQDGQPVSNVPNPFEIPEVLPAVYEYTVTRLAGLVEGTAIVQVMFRGADGEDADVDISVPVRERAA